MQTTANISLNSKTTFLPWRENLGVLPISKVCSSSGHKAPWQSQQQQNSKFSQIIILMLLHIPTQEGVSGLRYWFHFSRKEIKNPPKYLSPIPWKPSAGPLSCYTLWCVSLCIRESEVSLSPLQPCLMVRYLQDTRHDGTGRSLQLHIFWASAICEDYEDKRGIVC